MITLKNITALKVAVTEYEELLIEKKDAGAPPHSDFWGQSLWCAEDKVKKAYKESGIKS